MAAGFGLSTEEHRTIAPNRDLGDLASAALSDPFDFSRDGPEPVVIFCAASTRAQRRAGEPWRVMCPSRALPSELRTLGVSPAQEHRCLTVGKRWISPISAMISMAV
jgi:hypothetical protein